MNIDADLDVSYKQFEAAVHPNGRRGSVGAPVICLPWKDT